MLLCLNMIVRNESQTILRCLDSAASVLDRLCIDDTGSTDNTLHLIKTWAKARSVPLLLSTEPFQNFGHNRTVALKRAQAWFNEETVDTFLLFLDADMELRVPDPQVFREYIQQYAKDHVLLLTQKNTALQYENVRVIHSKKDVVCVGSTHEYYQHSCGRWSMPQEVGYIFDVGDGGHKTKKYERDERLLLDDLRREGKNPRAWFYLANTYRDSGQHEKAIYAYNARIELGGWPQEVYCCYLYRGRCHRKLSRSSEAVESFREAARIVPCRSESYYELAALLLSRCQNFWTAPKTILEFCFHLFVLADESRPTEKPLFEELTIPQWKAKNQLSILCFYLEDKKSRGREYCKQLLDASHHLPVSVYEQVKKNLKFYQ